MFYCQAYFEPLVIHIQDGHIFFLSVALLAYLILLVKAKFEHFSWKILEKEIATKPIPNHLQLLNEPFVFRSCQQPDSLISPDNIYYYIFLYVPPDSVSREPPEISNVTIRLSVSSRPVSASEWYNALLNHGSNEDAM